VFRQVGVEPSGDAFNAIVFDPRTNRPFNPMVNAGAITISTLMYEALGADAMDYLLGRFSDAAGRTLSISEAVYHSEATTGHRNRAIAHLLLSVGATHGDVEPGLDLYFRQCSILVTAVDLARMGATLANLGTNPFTGVPVFDLRAVRDTLSVMLTCGMYDYSGNWVVDVGVPCKSGVGGGIMGAVTGRSALARSRLGSMAKAIQCVACMPSSISPRSSGSIRSNAPTWDPNSCGY
jgi:glutaminase